MAVATQARRRPQGILDIAAENSKMKVQVEVLYNLLVFCRDVIRIKGGSLADISKIESALRSVKVP